MNAFIQIILSGIMLIASSVFSQVYAANNDVFCCVYTGPQGHECWVNADQYNCNTIPVEGTWEQNYCRQFSNDPDACNNACTYCEEAQPSPTTVPGGPSATPRPNVCHQCYSNPGSDPWCAPGGDNGNGTCQYFNNYYDCSQNCNPSYVPPTVAVPTKRFRMCDSVGPTESPLFKDCYDCMSPTDPKDSGSWTALGCIRADPSSFINSFLEFGIGIAGGIAFLLILIAGFQIMTSSGNPEKLNGGKELLGAAITGLILIIFSVFVLRLIGVDILDLPGFE